MHSKHCPVGIKPYENCCLAALKKYPVTSPNHPSIFYRLWQVRSWSTNQLLLNYVSCLKWHINCKQIFQMLHLIVMPWQVSCHTLRDTLPSLQLTWRCNFIDKCSRFVVAWSASPFFFFFTILQRGTWYTMQDGCFMWISWLCYISGYRYPTLSTG